MERFIRPIIVLLLFLFISGISLSGVQAADSAIVKPSKLTLKVSLDDPKEFWNFVFLTRDGNFVKAASIQVGWSLGELSKSSKYETVVKQGKGDGQLEIVTEKGALVNYRVSIRDARNEEIGSLSMQVSNRGQIEYVGVTNPEYTEPIITYGNEAAPSPNLR